MENTNRKRWSAIILWIVAATVTIRSLCWRIFLPNYYQLNTEAWHIWLKEAAVLFVFPLIFAPTGI